MDTVERKEAADRKLHFIAIWWNIVANGSSTMTATVNERGLLVTSLRTEEQAHYEHNEEKIPQKPTRRTSLSMDRTASQSMRCIETDSRTITIASASCNVDKVRRRQNACLAPAQYPKFCKGATSPGCRKGRICYLQG
jgi:hypothetical protein